MPEKFSRPLVKNPTRADAGTDGHIIKTERLSARLGGNSGNVAFIHAILKQIEGIRHVSEMGKRVADVNVLGCSNQVNPNIKKSADDAVFAETDAPFVAIGLGAQAADRKTVMDIPEGTRAYIQRIQDSAPGEHPNISLRGNYTYEVMRKAGLHERCVPLGCPSLHIHPNNKLGVLIERKLKAGGHRVAVAPGNVARLARRYVELERSLAGIAEEGGGGYIVQHPVELMALVRDGVQGADARLLEKMRETIRPKLDASGFERWLGRNMRLFTSATAWMEHLRGIDLVVGTRIHGCMLALQAATPALCVTLDSRQEELCEIMQIPNIAANSVIDGISIEQARAVLAKHDWMAFDANRIDLARRYRHFLEQNRLTVAGSLNRLTA